ncbi:hypothetical protein GF324_07605 [bacterium]|nr:hypothetical protein [bacterium]
MAQRRGRLPELVRQPSDGDESMSRRWFTFLLLLLTSAAVRAQIDLSVWPGNVAFNGVGTSLFGYATASGDLNGDGYWDYAFSAPNENGQAGRVYVFFGSASALDSALFNDPFSAADLVVTGEAGMQLGRALAMGDVNGDMREDLLIGAPRAVPGGEVWIILGADGLSGEITTPDVRIHGAGADDNFGTAIAVSLINPSDTMQDLLIGSPGADVLERNNAGRVDVVQGRMSWPDEIDLSEEAADVTLFGPSTAARYGRAIAGAPSFQGTLLGNNLNGDGWGDLVAGSPGETFLGRTGSGVVHAFFTGESLVDTVDLADGNSLEGYRRIGGENFFDRLGQTLWNFEGGVSSYLLVGAPGRLDVNVRPGSVYQFTWNEFSDGVVNVDLRSAERYQVRITGASDGDSLGAMVAGTAGLRLFSAPGAAYLGRSRAGLAYVLPGMAELTGRVSVHEIGPSLRTIAGAETDEQLARGFAVGDFDDDGLPDLVAGAPGANSAAGFGLAMRGGLPHGTSFYPSPGRNAVPVETEIRFSLRDEESEIDPGTLYLLVDGTVVGPADLNLTYESENGVYQFTYQPPEAFAIDVPVEVELQVEDDEGYRSPLYRWQFTTGADDLAPTVSDFDPAPGEIAVAVTRDVECTVSDAGAGVDSTSLQITLNGETIFYDDPDLTVTGTPAAYRVSYDPPELFPANSEVTVTLRAADRVEPEANVMTPFTYSFYTTSDETPPEIVEIFPEPGAQIDVSTTIRVRIEDDNAGVDPDNTSMDRTQNSSTVEAPLSWVSVENGYVFRHDPAGNPYTAGALAITAGTQDLAEPSNAAPDSSWNYTVVEDELPPFLVDEFPVAFSDSASRNTPIVFTLSDNAAGVDSASIDVTINGVNQDHARFLFERQDHRSLTLTYNLPSGLYGDTVQVDLSCVDLATTANSLDTSYYFTTISDNQAPVFHLIDPPPGAEAVPVTDSLVWEAGDDLTGVNPESFTLLIDEETHTGDIRFNTPPSSPEAEYRFVYLPAEPFAYEDTLQIAVSVADYSEPANVSTRTYQVATEADEEPPFLQDRSPFPEQTGIARNTDIVFQVVDLGVGTARDSIRLAINDVPVPFGEMQVEELARGFAVTYNPPGLFGHEDTVRVRVVGYDLAAVPNRMEESYWFVTLSDDRDPPYLEDIAPADSTDELAQNFQLAFTLKDDGAGVDTLNTTVSREGGPWDVSTRIRAVEDGFRYEITPNTPYLWSDEVVVIIRTRDLATPPNSPLAPFRLTYFTQRDEDPPVFTDLTPPPDSSITFNRYLSALVVDEAAGVDTSSVQIFVDGADVSDDAAPAPSETGYLLRYRPENGWVDRDEFQVRLYAEDRSAVRNAGETEYRFFIRADEQAPFVVDSLLTPAPNDTSVARDDALRFTLLDEGVGLDPAALELTVFGQSFGGFAGAVPFGLDSLGWSFTLPLDNVELFPGQWVEVVIGGQDRADPPNVMESVRYRFRMERPSDDVAVVPTTITPNGDGVWDEALIYGPEDVTALEVEIYDLRGRLLGTVTGNPARWDGRDRNGNTVPGGLYILQMNAGGQVRQRTIAVAR